MSDRRELTAHELQYILARIYNEAGKILDPAQTVLATVTAIRIRTMAQNALDNVPFDPQQIEYAG